MKITFTLLPIQKLMHMLFTQVSKPLAYRIARYAKRSPFFKNRICVPLAKLHGRVEKVYGSEKTTPTLTEDEAVELGTTIIAEALIFCITASVIISEFNRAMMKARAAEEERIQELQDLRNAINGLILKMEEQEILINDAIDTIGINENEENLEITPAEPGHPPRHHHKCFRRIIPHHRVSYSSEFNKNLFHGNQHYDQCIFKPDSEYSVRCNLVNA